MISTVGFKLNTTEHARAQIVSKGLSVADVEAAFAAPEKVYPNKKFAGQYRVVGKGICLVGKPSNGTFTLITVYEDGKMTPPRPEQLNTPEGRAYAERYAKQEARVNEYYPRIASRRAKRN